MGNRAFYLIAGSLAFCFPLCAQQTYGPDLYSAVNNSVLRFPSLTLPDAQLFSFSSAFNRMETTRPDLLPASALLTTTTQRRIAYVAPGADSKDSSKEVSDVSRRNLLDYVHGEIGFLYGRSTGRFGGGVEQGYIIGDVGDDKFQISVGAAYQHSSGRFPRTLNR
jgi:hypothetical protein